MVNSIDLSSEAQLTRVAQMILDKVTEFNKFSLEEIKEFVRMRVDEIINN